MAHTSMVRRRDYGIFWWSRLVVGRKPRTSFHTYWQALNQSEIAISVSLVLGFIRNGWLIVDCLGWIFGFAALLKPMFLPEFC